MEYGKEINYFDIGDCVDYIIDSLLSTNNCIISVTVNNDNYRSISQNIARSNRNIQYGSKVFSSDIRFGQAAVYQFADAFEEDLRGFEESESIQITVCVERLVVGELYSYDMDFENVKNMDALKNIFSTDNSKQITSYMNLREDFVQFLKDSTKKHLIITYSVKNDYLNQYIRISTCISKIFTFCGFQLVFTLFRPDIDNSIMDQKITNPDYKLKELLDEFTQVNIYMKDFCRKVSDNKFVILEFV